MYARSYFNFVSGDFVAGDIPFNLEYAHATKNDFALPRDSKLTLRVRAA